MRAIWLLSAVTVVACIIGYVQLCGCAAETDQASPGEIIRLPAPSHDSNTSIEQALFQRKSVREFRDEPLSLSDVSQLLWAAQGLTATEGRRTTPSAGALYPLEVYIVAGNVRDLPPGAYKYRPADHSLVMTMDGDKRAALSRAAIGQSSVEDSAMVIVIAGVYERTTGKYDTPVHDERAKSDYPAGVKYVHMEAGHASQNVYLESVSLGLGTVAIGAFSGEGVRSVTGMPDEERPLYLMPVGRA